MSRLNDLINGFIQHPEFNAFPACNRWDFVAGISPHDRAIADEVIDGLVQYIRNSNPGAEVFSSREVDSCGSTSFMIGIKEPSANGVNRL